MTGLGDASDIPVLIEEGTRFEGIVCFRGHSHIAGELRGEIAATGRLEIGETGRVTGRIEADQVQIAGYFEGEVLAREGLEILGTGQVDGTLVSPRMSADEGCKVRGACRTVRSVPKSGEDSDNSPSSS